MQQITKLILNVGGIPGNWAEPVGLPCEIVPLIKPYGMWTGNVFKGQVLSNGKPVAGAEVEVEYMSHMPNLKTNSMPAKSPWNTRMMLLSPRPSSPMPTVISLSVFPRPDGGASPLSASARIPNTRARNLVRMPFSGSRPKI